MYFTVSACLAGFKCRYDGKYQGNPIIENLYKNNLALPICPELLGGLKTPRIPCEISNGQVLTKCGQDYTENFLTGALRAYALIKQAGCQVAILKSCSPSCGYGFIYDGTFQKKLVQGNGFLAQILWQSSMPIYNENNFHQLNLITKL